jgi:hypothetical protein
MCPIWRKRPIFAVLATEKRIFHMLGTKIFLLVQHIFWDNLEKNIESEFSISLFNSQDYDLKIIFIRQGHRLKFWIVPKFGDQTVGDQTILVLPL